MYQIETPAGDHTGEVVGIHFVGGKAEVDDLTDAQKAYLARQHYLVKLVKSTRAPGKQA